MAYVTYDDESGNLTGAYLQPVAPVHQAQHISVSDEIAEAWTRYRANVSRDSVEPIPPAEPVPPAPPTVAEYVRQVQTMLDAKARERNYDGILSACTYATSTVPKFQAEGQACVEWRDAVWSQCYVLLDQVSTGELAQPSIEALLAMLPQLEWPEDAVA